MMISVLVVAVVVEVVLVLVVATATKTTDMRSLNDVVMSRLACSHYFNYCDHLTAI